jgi:hypothetical protein
VISVAPNETPAASATETMAEEELDRSSSELCVPNGRNPRGINDGDVEPGADDFGCNNDNDCSPSEDSSGEEEPEVTHVKHAPSKSPLADDSDSEDEEDLYTKFPPKMRGPNHRMRRKAKRTNHPNPDCDDGDDDSDDDADDTDDDDDDDDLNSKSLPPSRLSNRYPPEVTLIGEFSTPVSAAAGRDLTWLVEEEVRKKINIFVDPRILVFTTINPANNRAGWTCGYCGSIWAGGGNATKALSHIAQEYNKKQPCKPCPTKIPAEHLSIYKSLNGLRVAARGKTSGTRSKLKKLASSDHKRGVAAHFEQPGKKQRYLHAQINQGHLQRSTTG